MIQSGAIIFRAFYCILACILLCINATKGQYAALPRTAFPFNDIPPADSCTIVQTNIDPLFIPDFHKKYPKPTVFLQSGETFTPESLEFTFYTLCGILLLVGLVYRLFPKYFQDLFSLLFKSGFRQKSIRDQLAQNTAAALGLNIIFFISAGLFIFLQVRHAGIKTQNPWYVDMYICIGFLAVVYAVKYLSVIMGGWIFAAKDLGRNYAFFVFYVNKIIGIFLLPVIVVLWIGKPSLWPVFQTISFIIIGFLLLYRYYLILPLVRNKSGVSPFHFFLYLCTFVILPILILVKFLVHFLDSSN
jgi:hypothetical protein